MRIFVADLYSVAKSTRPCLERRIGLLNRRLQAGQQVQAGELAGQHLQPVPLGQTVDGHAAAAEDSDSLRYSLPLLHTLVVGGL